MQKKWMSAAGKLAMIVLGNLLYALAVTVFIVPNQLITGGTTGLALFFNRTAGIPISAFVSVFNITMFLLGAWVLGKQFAVTTVMSTVIYPLLLGILERAGDDRNRDGGAAGGRALRRLPDRRRASASSCGPGPPRAAWTSPP